MNGLGEATSWVLGIDVLVRATLLLGGAIVAGWALGRGRSGLRHAAWTATFVALLLLPALVRWGPRLELPLLPSEPGDATSAALATWEGAPVPAGFPEPGMVGEPAVAPVPTQARSGGAERARQSAAAVGNPGAASVAPSTGTGGPATLILAVWALGAAGALMSLLVGAARFRAVVRRARPVTSERIAKRAASSSEQLGLRRSVRLLESDEVPTPVAGGLVHPVVILPDGADRWSDERLDVVLAHELIHVRRYDAVRQLLGQVALALYWFHPLSWFASRMAVTTREHACDEAVLAMGTRPSAYAQHLMHLSDGVARPLRLAALPMVHRTQLESRIMSILTPEGRRRSAFVTSVTMVAFCVFGATAAVAIPVALDSTRPGISSGPSAAPAEGAPVPTFRSVEKEALSPAVVPALSQEMPACPDRRLSGNFTGRYDSDDGRVSLSGWHNGDRIIQRYVDGLRLCLRVHGEVVMTDDGTEVRAVGRDGWLVLESEGDDVHRLVVTEGSGGIVREWTVNGDSRPFDEDAQQWRSHMLGALDALWEAARIRGEASSLRGEISSMRGHVSSLRGQISSHRGHVSSLRGQISSMRGHVSSLKGQASSMRGHVSSLNGQISSLRGEISSLRSGLRVTDDAATRARLAREIEEHEVQIEAVMREIESYGLEDRVGEVQREVDAYDLEDRLAAVEREIEAYALDQKVEELERRIDDFDLDAKVAEKEREIEALDADRRAAEIEESAEVHVEALRRIIG